MWIDTKPSKFLHRVLSRLCLLFPYWAHNGDQAHVNEANILLPYSELELSQSLDKGGAFNVADCST